MRLIYCEDNHDLLYFKTLCVRKRVCVCVHGRVCVCEREREREREKERERVLLAFYYVGICCVLSVAVVFLA